MINQNSREIIARKYLRKYLEVAPLALAIFRSIEAKNISRVKMQRPILDVGCGFGEFAGVFFNSKVEMGLDISWKELITAQKSNKYQKLAWVDAKEMPFADNFFGTVLSVSVFEHVTGVNNVLSEVYRVLKPGHKFVFTANTSKINQYLFWPKLLEKLGFPNLASKYIKLYHRVFKHVTLWSPQRWKKELEMIGFKIIIMEEIISPQATKTFDFLIPFSWPYQLYKVIFGKRWSWKPGWLKEYLADKYVGLVAKDEGEGSNLFVVAQKPLRE